MQQPDRHSHTGLATMKSSKVTASGRGVCASGGLTAGSKHPSPALPRGTEEVNTSTNLQVPGVSQDRAAAFHLTADILDRRLLPGKSARRGAQCLAASMTR